MTKLKNDGSVSYSIVIPVFQNEGSINDVFYKIKDILIENPVGNLLIEGYASADGSEEYNIELSVKRAEAVRDFLNKIGINIERLEVRGLGVNSPVGNNESPEGRAENRRVQFIYKN